MKFSSSPRNEKTRRVWKMGWWVLASERVKEGAVGSVRRPTGPERLRIRRPIAAREAFYGAPRGEMVTGLLECAILHGDCVARREDGVLPCATFLARECVSAAVGGEWRQLMSKGSVASCPGPLGLPEGNTLSLSSNFRKVIQEREGGEVRIPPTLSVDLRETCAAASRSVKTL